MNIPSPLKSVYSYYYPQTRKIISKISDKYPHEIFLQSIEPGLDEFHFKIIEKYKQYFKNWMKGIKKFKQQYFTNGSSEGIFHILAEISTYRKDNQLYILEGEYEGYQGYGQNLGLNFKSISYDQNFKKIKPGIFFISNPSARNGQIIPNEKINEIGNAGHKIVLDLTYLGMTKEYCFDLTNSAIEKIVCSMSKPFGLYYYRIGFVFSKKEIKTLIPNKRFKNIFSLIVAYNILDKFNQKSIYKKYKSFQSKSLNLFKKKYGIKPQESDVYLLAYLEESKISLKLKTIFKSFKRGKYYRFCLSPLFQYIEKNLSNNK